MGLLTLKLTTNQLEPDDYNYLSLYYVIADDILE